MLACAGLTVTPSTPTAIPPSATLTASSTPAPTIHTHAHLLPHAYPNALPDGYTHLRAHADPHPRLGEIRERGIEIWLPESYVGGNPADDKEFLLDVIKSEGGDYKDAAKMFENNPSAFVFWAFDTKVGKAKYLTTVNIGREKLPSILPIETILNLTQNQLPKQFDVIEQGVVELGDTQAGRMVLEFSANGAKGMELVYLVKEGDELYTITFITGAKDFEKRLKTFEQSMKTFRILP